MIYLIKWALALTLLYSLYGLTLRRETFHTLNRAVLLIILVASAVLPLFHIPLGHETWINQGFERLENALAADSAPDETFLSGQSTQIRRLHDDDAAIAQSSSCNRTITIVQSANPSSFPWTTTFIGAYILATSAFWLVYLRSLIGVVRLIRRSSLIEERVGVRILSCPELKNSCSWMRWVLVAEAGEESSGKEFSSILTHELAHVRLGHSWDKLLCELTCRTLWFLPFAWMLREDMNDVHEFEADRAVLRTGIDIRAYNQLLILKAVRPGLQPVVNAFNQSRIKKRITMMFKPKSTKWRAAKALYLLPMGLLAIMAFAQPPTQVVAALPENESILSVTDNKSATNQGTGPKMLTAFIMPEDCKNPYVKKHGNGISVTWLKGTWVQEDNNSFIEEHPVCTSPWLFPTKENSIRLNGKELDINNLPDLPASALKKMEIHIEAGQRWVNLITTPVQIPADVKGNINPELTVLLTGTPPKDNPIKSSIYVKGGIHDCFDWKKYQYTSWTSTIENIGMQLEEVAIRKDHHVRVNVCRGVSRQHVERIQKLMQENGVTNYELVNQE